jgi:pimeloyl-ACP methyl ester carboxylesterase
VNLAEPLATDVRFAEFGWGGRRLRIEHQWIAPTLRQAQGERGREAPLVVFLHEGLGSLSMWKDFPQRLCDAAGLRGLVFSRPGYGRSTPTAADASFDVDYMHREAHDVLPALFKALGVHRPWLFGHSDGGSIALLHAARFPDAVAGAVLVAPHIVVEDLSVSGIANARAAYLDTDMPERFAKYHADPDAVFWRWNRIWLDPRFKSWSIADELPRIACPLLAAQGTDDEYGTLEQIRGIARSLPRQTELLELPDCRHSAHKDQPERLIEAAASFIHRHSGDLQ